MKWNEIKVYTGNVFFICSNTNKSIASINRRQNYKYYCKQDYTGRTWTLLTEYQRENRVEWNFETLILDDRQLRMKKGLKVENKEK